MINDIKTHEQLRRQIEKDAVKNKRLLNQYGNVLIIGFVVTISMILLLVLQEWSRTADMYILTASFFIITIAVMIFLRKQCRIYKQLQEQCLELEDLTLPYDLWKIKRIKWCLAFLAAAAAAAGIAFIVASRLLREKQFKETVTAISDLQDPYSRIIAENVPEKLKGLDLEYVTDVTARGTVYFIMSSDNWYLWRESASVTLYVTDRFDRSGDSAKYKYLCQFKTQAEAAIHDAIKENLPEIYELDRSVTEQIQSRKSEHIQHKDDYRFIVKTPENSYEYSKKSNAYNNYYVLNGKEHSFKKVRRETNIKRTTPTPTPTPRKKRSISKKPYVFDYDDVHNYDDPEDFWDDHEDEFEDFEDAWDYWEENQ